MVLDEQLDLFEPLAAALALRDTPYNSTAHAIAELVDNSIDARAKDIDILIMTRRERTNTGQSVSVVSGLAVADNGHGMTQEVLAQALVVGGRPKEGGGIRRRMGKYGVGLPTASLSQCLRVDAWSWQAGVGSSWRGYLSVEEVKAGNARIPRPWQEAPPVDWLSQCSTEIRESLTGTLVVWSGLDRVDWRTARTTRERVEEEVGRIYRNFIRDHDIRLVIHTFGDDGDVDESHVVRPNDPMYLMEGTIPPHWKPDEPMFDEWGEKSIPVYVNGAKHVVEISYSRVKSPVLLEQGTNAAGSTEYGRRAARNVGISVVREGRELMTLPPLNNIGDPRNRWWGCELRFSSACDDLFGVDHSKQLAGRLQAVHRSVQRTQGSNTDDEEQRARTEGDPNIVALYNIVKTIDQDTREMFLEIRRLRSKPASSDPTEQGPDFSGGAGAIATNDVNVAVQQGDLEPSSSDVARDQLSTEERRMGVELDLLDDDLEPDLAAMIATWVASRKVGFVINPGRVSGSAIFDVRNDHGTIRVVLNQEHRLFGLLRHLTDSEALDDDDSIDGATDSTLVLYLLLLAWARMFEQTRGTQARQQLEDIVMRWGSEANYMLSTTSRRVVGEEE